MATSDEVLARLLQDRGGVSAATGGGYKPATVNFDWLGQLPQISDIAGQQRARAETLANLSEPDLSKPEANEAIARRLFTANDFEGGLKFMDIAHKQRTLEEQQAFRKIYGELGGMGTPPPGKKVGGEVPGTGERQEYPNPFAAPAVPQVAPAAAPPANWPANPLGPQSSLVPPPEPGAPLSPSDQIIAAAQGGVAPQGPLGPQVAQAGGMPPIGGGPVPSAPGLPSWFNQGLAVRPAPAAPEAPSAPPPVGARPRVAPTGTPTPGQVDDINTVAQRLVAAGKAGKGSAGMPGTVADLALFRNLVARTYRTDAPYQDYLNDQADRALEGRSTMTYSDWKVLQTRMPEIHKEASAQYAEISKDAKAGQNFVTQSKLFNDIVSKEEFIGGSGSPSYARLMNRVSSLRDLANYYGIPFPDISVMEKPAELFAAADGVAKQMVLAQLGGSLQKGVSEGDRVFSTGLSAQLASNKEGALLLNDINRALAQRRVDLGKLVGQYMHGNIRANTPEMDKLLQDYSDQHPLFVDAAGNMTPEGRSIYSRFQNPTVQQPSSDLVDGPGGSRWIKQGGRLVPVPQGKGTEQFPGGR